MERSDLAGRDFVSTADWSIDELDMALDVAHELKAAFKRGKFHRLLDDKTLFMIFLDLSTRTRNAFEAGMTQLGGHAHFLDSDATQISHGETPEDTGKILASMGHGICIRHDLVLNEGNTRHLNSVHTVFGKVTDGMDVVNSIAKVATGSRGPYQDVPEQPVVIEKVSVVE